LRRTSTFEYHDPVTGATFRQDLHGPHGARPVTGDQPGGYAIGMRHAGQRDQHRRRPLHERRAGRRALSGHRRAERRRRVGPLRRGHLQRVRAARLRLLRLRPLRRGHRPAASL